MILGTAAYMSPEQARGKTVDKRADIWAFGVVLTEMVTGRRLFEGETVSDTLAAVLTREPEWDRAPVTVRRLMRRCLEKDPKRRLRDIGDAMSLLDETLAAPESVPPRSRLAVSLGALAAAGALVAVALATLDFRDQPPLAYPVQFEIPLPGKAVFGDALSVSPDGRQIAFIADRQIWVRALDSTQARLLAGTEGATTALVWSPDSRFLLFFTQVSVKKIDASGGPSETLCGSCPYVRGAAWNREGVILLQAPEEFCASLTREAHQLPSYLRTRASVGISISSATAVTSFMPRGAGSTSAPSMPQQRPHPSSKVRNRC